jgi:hypothetical protein
MASKVEKNDVCAPKKAFAFLNEKLKRKNGRFI